MNYRISKYRKMPSVVMIAMLAILSFTRSSGPEGRAGIVANLDNPGVSVPDFTVDSTFIEMWLDL